MRRRPLLGVGLTLVAAALWGTTGTVQSFAPAHTSPYWVGALRLLVASLFLGAWSAARGRSGAGAHERPWPASAWLPTVFAGACVALYNLAFFAGVKATGVALGTALAIGSGPVWAGLIQAGVLRRRPPPIWWVGTALAVTGGACMSGAGGGAPRVDAIGAILCLSAGLAYASYTLISQSVVDRVSPGRLTLRTFAVAALIAVPAARLVAGQLSIAPRGWAVIVYLGVIATGVAYRLFSHALRHIPGATAVTLALAEPITAFALATTVVGETPGAPAFVGLALVVAGLVVVVWAEARAAGSVDRARGRVGPRDVRRS